ncbi:arylsulfatase J-like [Diadema antillarum]|uniref:arylsulfatase J-like n=1 Tax=Diadema antillarum TaxID=105358 RepID=UPI003A89F0D1
MVLLTLPISTCFRVAVVATIVCFVADASPPSPHIVFVIVDDMGFNDVGYHSNDSEIETPVLDDLAGRGVKLENYYVAPLCTPTRSMLLTGRYLIHNGQQHLVIDPVKPRCLPLDDATLADKLTEANYSTHMVGKWHLGFYKKACWPMNRGFQSFFGKLLGSGDHFSHNVTHKNNAGGRCGHDFTGMDLRDGETNVQPDYEGVYSTEIFTEWAQKIIRSHNADESLFLYLAYQAPHLPIQVPDSYAYPRNIIKNKDRRYYAGMISYLDESIGNLIDTLEWWGLWNDTVFVFTSDNGGVGGKNAGSNWPLRGAKGNYFEGGIRTVGFITSPLLPASVRGTTSTALMHVSDWFPTLLEGVAGATINETELQLDGVNMWDTITNGTSGSDDREIVYNIDPLMRRPSSIDPKYDNQSLIFDVGIQAAIRRGDMKLITGYQADTDWFPTFESGLSDVSANDPAGKAVWLFNITADPLEENDLSDSMGDVVDDLLGRLWDYYNSTRFVPPVNERKDCDSDPALHGDLWTCWEC